MDRVLPIWYDLLFEIRSKSTIVSVQLTILSITGVVIATTLVLGLVLLNQHRSVQGIPAVLAEERPTLMLDQSAALPTPTPTPPPTPPPQNNRGCPSPGWAELWLYNVDSPAGWEYKHAVYEDPPLGWTYDVCVDCYSLVGVIVEDIDEGIAFYSQSPYIDRIGVWRFVGHDGQWYVTDEREPPLVHTIWPDSWNQIQIFKDSHESWPDALQESGNYRQAQTQIEWSCPK